MEHGKAPPRVGARSAGRLVVLAHAVPVVWLFGGALFGGRLPYARDVSAVYVPDFAFLHQALGQGVWPLWNPYVDGGSPCLFTYPVDLVLSLVLGPRGPVGPGAALHLYLAMGGASVLARRLGQGALGAWIAGTAYGLGGYVLSTMNLLQFLEAAAWAPWVLAALLRVQEAPGRRTTALLALAVALQASTLCLEIALQTLVAGLVLVSWRRIVGNRAIRWLAIAAAIAFLLAAPAILGGAWLIQGSQRAQGFTAEQVLAYSASPPVLLEALVPRLFGDVHAFSEVGYWGQPFFPQGYPYLLSLYVGPLVFALALFAPWRRLHGLLFLGVLLALGQHGPFGQAFAQVSFVRGPVKFFFMATLALSLLAGEGLERALASAAHRRRARSALFVLGGLLLSAGAALSTWPGLVSAVADPRALVVAETIWPASWMATGAVCLVAALALAGPARLASLAVVAVVLDLTTVNGGLNPLAEASFYDLRAEMADLVREMKREGPYRIFSYGAANAPGLRWEPGVARAGSDVWLYYVDRQSLLPRTHELDGLEGIFDNDRTGWAPEGAALTLQESEPSAFPRILPRLRAANVRFVLSFVPLGDGLVALRRRVAFPELLDPLLVYEIEDALPRASWAATAPEATADPARPPAGKVTYARLDPHTVEVRAEGAPGDVVVRDYAHPDWRLAPDARPGREGRFFRWATPGGERTFLLRFRPSWRAPALVLLALGALVVLGMLAIPSAASPHKP